MHYQSSCAHKPAGIAARSDASKRDALAATREGALALALVRELLTWADCRFSAKVLEAEVGYGSAAPAPLERARLAEELVRLGEGAIFWGVWSTTQAAEARNTPQPHPPPLCKIVLARA